jgi:hypothetical protein
VFTEANDPERAARLLGQVDSLVEEIHLLPPQYARTVRKWSRRELESRLDPACFAACFEEGRSTPCEGIVSLALSGVD